MVAPSKDKFVFVSNKAKDFEEFRPSLTYWADAWRRLRKNKLSMIGLVTIIVIVIFGFFGPMFSSVTYSDQQNDYKNLPPVFPLYQLDEGLFAYVSGDYNMFIVDEDGYLVERLEEVETKAPLITFDFTKPMSPADTKKKNDESTSDTTKTYKLGDEDILLDYTGKVTPELDWKYEITYKDNVVNQIEKKSLNRLFPFGTDGLGRNLLVRVMYGARISLIVAFVATVVNLVIGVTYGAIAGFKGGGADNIMMRIVDIINSIPLMIIVILIMVLVGNQGLWTIILTLGSVYWVSMARLVRGQILALKEQEFVLAATTLGVSQKNIIFRHLIPNALGPILVSMTMMIPSAVFTEAFLSFIGLGVSAPMASLGTLANAALSALLTYPYQLFFPALTIAIIILAFNFVGDGLRDALDPRLRKG